MIDLGLRVDFHGDGNKHVVMWKDIVLYMTQNRRDADLFVAQLRIWFEYMSKG